MAATVSACLRGIDWCKAWAHDGANSRADLLRPICETGGCESLARLRSFWGFLWECPVSCRSARLPSMSRGVSCSARLTRGRFISRRKRSSCCRSWSTLARERFPNASFTSVCGRRLVSEATLSSLVAELREALGDRGRDALYIRTLHGYGYAFSAPAAPPASSIGTITNWIVCDGREIPLGDGEHVLGRDSDVRVELRSPAVSRHHARIVISGMSATLEDLGSKNGTSVRGQTLSAPIQLADGDEIQTGSFVLTLRTVSAKGSTESAAR